MKALVVLALVALHSPPFASPGQVRVHTQDVRVAPGGAPQEFTLECQARESLLSGGFSHDAVELRVLASYPSPTRPAWSVTVVNPARTALGLTISVVCASGEVASTVRVVTGSTPTLSVECPNGTLVTGGGYSSSTAAIVSSYPAAGEGWAVTAVPLAADPGTVSIYAVCLGGSVRPAGAGIKDLLLVPQRPSCSPAPGGSAPACAFPRQGAEAVTCEGDLVGGGYELAAEGRPPAYPVVAASIQRDAWRVAVMGLSADDAPMSLRLLAVCVMFPSPGTPETPLSVEPIAQRDEILPIVATTCLVAALVLAFILVMSARLRSRSRRGQHATISVVLTSHHSSFRLDELREIP